MARNFRFFLRSSGAALGPMNLALTEKNEPEIFFQLRNVLRAREGDNITLVEASGGAASLSVPGGSKVGKEYLFELKEITKKECVLNFLSEKENTNELNMNLELWLCLPNKPEKLDFIVQKAVELGVKKIVLIKSDHSQFKHNLKMERLGKIVMEASEQSERAVVAQIECASNLNEIVMKTKNSGGLKDVYVAMERADGFTNSHVELKHIFKNGGLKDQHTNTFILIGPEGGFSEEEKKLIKTSNLHTFSMGKQILRMETAVILALGVFGILCYNWRK